jgi:hypothetical protein
MPGGWGSSHRHEEFTFADCHPETAGLNITVLGQDCWGNQSMPLAVMEKPKTQSQASLNSP